MRVCVICELNSIHSQRWIRFFTNRGHEVHVIAPYPPYPIKIEGATLYWLKRKLGVKGINKVINYLRLIIRSYLHIKTIRPDLLNVLFLTDYGFFGALSRFHPFVTIPWGSDVLRHPFQKKFWHFINSYALKKSDLVICNSKPMYQTLVKKIGVPENKIMNIIWSGVDFNLFHYEDTVVMKKRLGLENKIVLFSSRYFEAIYNIDCIILMFAEFKREIPNSQLMIAGEGSLKKSLINLCEKLNFESEVTFLGKIPSSKYRNYLNVSDLYLTVPASDSCASSLLEAFACKRIIVASDIEANRAWIKNGENGWLVNPKDPKLFSQTCVRAINKPISRSAIEKNFEIVKNKADHYSNMMMIEKKFYQITTTKKND